MANVTSLAQSRIMVIVVLALSFVVLAAQATLVRPYLWPAGAGVTLSGDTVFASLAEPRPVPRIRPPDVDDAAGLPVTVTLADPSLHNSGDFLAPGAALTGIGGVSGQTLNLSAGLPPDHEAVLRVWRDAYRMGTRGPVTLRVAAAGQERTLTVERQPVWQAPPAARSAWLRLHLGPLLQVAAFLTGALILVALGTRGNTATLMTLALVATAIANGGPLYGAEYDIPLIGSLMLVFAWIATPLSFPIIGLAVLHFPSRAAVLDRHRWIYPALAAAAAPMLVVSVLAAAFLAGLDAVAAPLAWIAAHGWVFDASFAVALAANVLIVIEGIYRYRTNLDVNERRRIQLVVYTGVPAVFAYALKTFVPLLSSLAGGRAQLPWLIEAVLQAIVLLPAFALPYAVATKHVFSPRTVLRRGLQYALARRTLSVLIVLPVAALVVALASDRNRPLGDILMGQPLFYAISLGLAAVGFKYRVAAQRWLDKRFFRAEYDAREILVSLANRVPYESDPVQLVSVVMTQIDNALQPESIAVFAGEDARLEVISVLRAKATPLPRDSGLATLLQWSDEPLEVFLDDERSPAARLPGADRTWLAATGVSLLVPIFAGTGESRMLVGLIALGQKRSEEPYTPEDRRLLSGIAAQMSVALDLSRLRRLASAGPSQTGTPTLTPTMIVGATVRGPSSLGMCPVCHRCFDVDTVRSNDGTLVCPDDASVLQPVIGMPSVVDGKYRVDAVVGRGGMGAVFRARDLRLERDVAIKVVRADLVSDPEARARFQREAQIIARLQHPAIVTVFDYGNLPDGAAFLVMEYVRGEDLRHLLKRERRLEPDRLVDLIAGIAAGVDAAHRAGVLHRDLKPENVLLPENGTGPKVLDFGVAKMTDRPVTGEAHATLTQGGTIVGTPAYMAPEQLRGEGVDGRADVYSLAVLTYEALTGRLPFGAGSFIDIGVKQAGGSAGVDTGGVPAHLAPALLAALSLSREERPASALAFAEQLRASRA